MKEFNYYNLVILCIIFQLNKSAVLKKAIEQITFLRNQNVRLRNENNTLRMALKKNSKYFFVTSIRFYSIPAKSDNLGVCTCP